jgi:hypothetical protein
VTRRVIVNVSVGSWYADRGAQRLLETLEERGENATRLFWRDEYPPGSPTHADAPYAFKPYAFQAARDLGFDQAIWLDASVWAHKKALGDVWARIDEDGWYLEPDGNMVGNWIGDRQLAMVGLTREQAFEVPLVEGKMIGLDFRNPTALDFLSAWLELADLGAFAGRWDNHDRFESSDERCFGHRHDIACGSPVAHRLGMGLQAFKRVGFPSNGEPGDEIVVLAEGM